MDRSDIIIRLARESDLLIITGIYNGVIKEGAYTADLETYSLAERRKWFLEHNTKEYGIYILENSNDVLGYFYFSPWRAGRSALNGVAELSFYLAKSSRGHGLGNILLERAIELSKAKGFTHLLAILLDNNTRSQNLLKKWGFNLIGNLPHVAKLKVDTVGQLIMLNTL